MSENDLLTRSNRRFEADRAGKVIEALDQIPSRLSSAIDESNYYSWAELEKIFGITVAENLERVLKEEGGVSIEETSQGVKIIKPKGPTLRKPKASTEHRPQHNQQPQLSRTAIEQKTPSSPVLERQRENVRLNIGAIEPGQTYSVLRLKYLFRTNNGRELLSALGEWARLKPQADGSYLVAEIYSEARRLPDPTPIKQHISRPRSPSRSHERDSSLPTYPDISYGASRLLDMLISKFGLDSLPLSKALGNNISQERRNFFAELIKYGFVIFAETPGGEKPQKVMIRIIDKRNET